jgi:hypothetical protein
VLGCLGRDVDIGLVDGRPGGLLDGLVDGCLVGLLGGFVDGRRDDVGGLGWQQGVQDALPLVGVAVVRPGVFLDVAEGGVSRRQVVEGDLVGGRPLAVVGDDLVAAVEQLQDAGVLLRVDDLRVRGSVCSAAGICSWAVWSSSRCMVQSPASSPAVIAAIPTREAW